MIYAVFPLCQVEEACTLNSFDFYSQGLLPCYMYFSQDASDKVSLMQPDASHLKWVSVFCPQRFRGYLSIVLTSTRPVMFHWLGPFIMSLLPFYKVRSIYSTCTFIIFCEAGFHRVGLFLQVSFCYRNIHSVFVTKSLLNFSTRIARGKKVSYSSHIL